MTAGVRIATLNLWGTRGDWSTRRGSAKPAFAELDADLITLQETILDGDYDQARDLLGDDYHLAHQSDREPDGPTGASTTSSSAAESSQTRRGPRPHDPAPHGSIAEHHARNRFERRYRR